MMELESLQCLPTISVIIPVNNSSHYLEKCLKSVCAQTYNNIEIILIENGSEDNSLELCKKWAKIDSRICWYSIANGNVSQARNLGLEVMHGEWFCFVDADDWIEKEYVDILLKNAIKNSCSISTCDYVRGCKERNAKKIKEKVEVTESNNGCLTAFIRPDKKIYGMVWNKLYNAELYGAFRFDTKLRINEDCMFIYNVMLKCNKLCSTNRLLYHWIYHHNSACHKKVAVTDFSAANVFLDLIEKIADTKDEKAILELKKNYILSVIKVLWDTRYIDDNIEVRNAIVRTRQWRGETFHLLPIVKRVKYYIAIHRLCIKDLLFKKKKL